MSDHRAQRLFERYGLVLTREEIDSLDALCTPQNRMRFTSDGSVHVIPYRDTHLVAVLIQLTAGKSGICTFLDPDTFTAGRGWRTVRAATGKGNRAVGWRKEMRLRRRREGRQVG